MYQCNSELKGVYNARSPIYFTCVSVNKILNQENAFRRSIKIKVRYSGEILDLWRDPGRNFDLEGGELLVYHLFSDCSQSGQTEAKICTKDFVAFRQRCLPRGARQSSNYRSFKTGHRPLTIVVPSGPLPSKSEP